MADPDQAESTRQQGIIHAPWERAFTRIISPFEEFMHRQTTSGLLLMGTALIAMLLANSFLVAGVIGFFWLWWLARVR